MPRWDSSPAEFNARVRAVSEKTRQVGKWDTVRDYWDDM